MAIRNIDQAGIPQADFPKIAFRVSEDLFKRYNKLCDETGRYRIDLMRNVIELIAADAPLGARQREYGITRRICFDAHFLVVEKARQKCLHAGVTMSNALRQVLEDVIEKEGF